MPEETGVDPGVPSSVDLWWAPVRVGAGQLAALSALLAPEEQRRAASYRHRADQERFAAARGWLRVLLADQLRCSPGEVRIVQEEGHKPRLGPSQLRFSGSRSGDVALFAISWTMDVGVDIEAIGHATDMDRTAARFFSPNERAVLAALAPEERLVASYRCWTRKEAYLKGIGTGLAVPLSRVEVGTGDVDPVTFQGWAIHQVEVAPGYAAAVAGEGSRPWVPAAPRKLSAVPVGKATSR